MKKSFLSLSLAIFCLTAVMTSCIYDPQTGEVVINEKVCVSFDENETDPTIESRVVCDKFREILLERLAEQGGTLDDVIDISVTSATYKVTSLPGHDWNVDARVFVDYDNDQFVIPRTLIRLRNQSLKALTHFHRRAFLRGAGVATLNAALDDLVAGGDPVVYLGLRRDSISPTPTEQDPMIFSWTACIEFQAVIDVTVE